MNNQQVTHCNKLLFPPQSQTLHLWLNKSPLKATRLLSASEVIDRKIMSAACWFKYNSPCNYTRLSVHSSADVETPYIVIKVIYKRTSFSNLSCWGKKNASHKVSLLLNGEKAVNQCQIRRTRTPHCFKNSCELFQPVFCCSCESFSIMACHDFLLSQGLGAHLTSLRWAHQVFDSPRLFCALT